MPICSYLSIVCLEEGAKKTTALLHALRFHGTKAELFSGILLRFRSRESDLFTLSKQGNEIITEKHKYQPLSYFAFSYQGRQKPFSPTRNCSWCTAVDQCSDCRIEPTLVIISTLSWIRRIPPGLSTRSTSTTTLVMSHL